MDNNDEMNRKNNIVEYSVKIIFINFYGSQFSVIKIEATKKTQANDSGKNIFLSQMLIYI